MFVVRSVVGRLLGEHVEVSRGKVGEGVEDGGSAGVVSRRSEDLEDDRAEEGVVESGWRGHFGGLEEEKM